ncbi:MAG: DEAD/DEAH box helicase/ATP-dependent helicase YprA [Treponematales bacterium]
MDALSPAEAKLASILADPAFAANIVVEKRLPAGEGAFAPFPDDLDSRLAGALRRRGIERLYTHQAEVWDTLRRNRNVVVVTPTASGKTLCYNLPVLDALLKDETARALYLFPTKALSQDQQSELNELAGGGGNREQGTGSGESRLKVPGISESVPGSNSDFQISNPFPVPHSPLPIKIATYDGDTPDSLRVSARDSGRVIISNPDMLHAGILPNHPKWVRFFSNLKFVVVDEAHAYRGVFGSHVASVLRRLRRVAAFYGSKPRFILCSATIANPRELAGALIGEDTALVDRNGAPRGEKRVILYNPPLVDAVQGIRRSSLDESRRWALAFLKAGVKTILFAHSRIKTEVAAARLNQDLANVYTGSHGIRVVPYRGGLLPSERRGIERGLREGGIQGVVSTNALELGIDIGGLDASVVAGFPGSLHSFWQQSGRAGRRGGLSVAVFVASASPIDQFIMENPDWFFGSGAEEARIDPDNPYIFTDHIKCACFELPFRDEETGEEEGEQGTGNREQGEEDNKRGEGEQVESGKWKAEREEGERGAGSREQGEENKQEGGAVTVPSDGGGRPSARPPSAPAAASGVFRYPPDGAESSPGPASPFPVPQSPLPVIFPRAADALVFLEEDGVVRHAAGRWHWADRSFPAEGVSLRSASSDNVVIIDTTAGRNAVIGEMDRPSAKEMLFKNAVYLHLGRQYLVEDLDIPNRKCLVREAEVNYYTDGLVKTDIKVLTEDEAFRFGGDECAARGALGDVLVRSQVSKFKKLTFARNENIGYGDIDLGGEEMQTRALALLFGEDTAGGWALRAFSEAEKGAALSGAGALIRRIAPVFLLCDPRDLGAAERVRDPHFAVPALYIYDKYPGGTGLAEALAGRCGELFAACASRVNRCPCASGCPSCTGPGVNKAAAQAFLNALAGESGGTGD